MYPKISSRKTTEGDAVYTYVCKMKERSQKSVCNNKNINGNLLDMAIIEQIKLLQDDEEHFTRQLEQSRNFYTGNSMDYEQQLSNLKKEKTDLEKKMESLVDSLTDMKGASSKAQVSNRIEKLSGECQNIEKRIQELTGLTSHHTLSNLEFDILRQLLTVFKDSIDEMSLEQKRAAVRIIIRKVIWDGVNTHMVLFGVSDNELGLEKDH